MRRATPRAHDYSIDAYAIDVDNHVKFEFDPKKDAANRKKHGISLAFAERLDWNAMVTRVDSRHDEERWFGIAPSAGQLYSVAFTVREEKEDNKIEEVVRSISLRRATKAEEKEYAKAKESNG